MSYPALGTLLVVVAMFVALATTSLPAHLVILVALAFLMAVGVVSPAGALSGLSNEGVVTVGALFVVAAAIQRTGVLGQLLQGVLGTPTGVRQAQARLLAPVALSSAFLNNTPIVAMLLPLVRDWAKRIGVPASKLLIPLSYGAILGGMCTLIGSSTNMVVFGLLREAGHSGMGLFELAWVGLPACLAGAAVMLALGPRLLPSLDDTSQAYGDPREYLTELRVVPGGPVDGKAVVEAGLRDLPGAYLVEVDRRDHVLAAVRPDEVLEGGDQLVFLAALDAVVELQRLPGLEPATEQVFRLEAPSAERHFVEAVVSATSPLIGRTVTEARFRNRYGAVVLGVSRAGERVEKRVAETRFRAGDGLLLETTASFLERHAGSRHFYLASTVEGPGPATRDRASVGVAILVALLALVGTGTVPMLHAALVAALAMVLFGVCSEETAFRAVDFRLLLAVAGALGVGHALTESGAADGLADLALALGGGSPLGSLAVVYVTTALLSELVTNNAAAAIMFPVAWAMSQHLGADPMPFVATLMIASSASFLSPLGYQTNLMVYGAGHYRFRDFLRLGAPVSLAVGLTTLAVAPRVWPLFPPGGPPSF